MGKSRYYIFVFILFASGIFYCAKATAQDSVYLRIIPVDTISFIKSDLHLLTNFSTADSCLHYVQQLPGWLSAEGFVSASVDSLRKLDDRHFVIQLFLGKKYRWKLIAVSTGDQALLAQLGVHTDDFISQRQPLSMARFKNAANRLLQYYMDQGFPFAKIVLDSVGFDGNDVSAILKIDKGDVYHIDSINVEGNAKISRNFLQHYLNIAANEPYNQQKLQAVDGLIRNLPYVEMKQPSTVSMRNTGAMLNLYLDKKTTNEIDAIVGFMPANGELGGKLLLTGQVSLHLKNAFGGGEIVGIDWQQLRPQSPKINLAFQRPYLFKSPFGLDLSFGLYKQDSLYVNAYGNIGALYQFSSAQTGRIFVNFASSRLLNVDTLAIIQSHQLPQVMDVSSVNIGFGYDFNNTDYRFNPRSGTELSATVLVGNKQVKKNNTVTQIHSENFNFSSLYDTVRLKSYQVKLQADAAHYFSLGKFSVLKTSANAGLYQSPAVFTNEMFLIGGYRLLRGFDEESIFANAYAVGSIEYRYLIGRNSFFFGFSDFGWSQFKNSALKSNDSYLSFGLGMAFETKAGIFNFSLASGKDKENSFGLGNAKVHIGYTTLF